MERQITQEQVTRAGLQTLRNSLYARMPGTVVSYDATSQTATVQPTLSDPRVDVDTGAIVFEPWQPFQGVPVKWFRCANGFVIAGYLTPGDPVVLEAWDLDPHPALEQGRSTQVANPNDVRRLSGGYWIAAPADMTGPIEDAAAAGAALVIGVDGDPAQIRISKGSLQLGRAGGDFVALASKVDACMSAIKTHTHPITVTGVTPGTGTGTGTSTASPALSSLPATGSALIGAQ